MRKLNFGAYRRERPRIVRWLDLHNLAGILLVVWMLAVWVHRRHQYLGRPCHQGLAIRTACGDDVAICRPPSGHSADIADGCGRNGTASATGYETGLRGVSRLIFSSKSHYGVFMRGNTPLTAKLLKPALIDAATGKLTDTRNLPWYVTALLISQPLHFGDYGGMPLKIIWAVLDVITIVVLITGLYLWLRRRQSGSSVERMLAATQAASNDPVLTS